MIISQDHCSRESVHDEVQRKHSGSDDQRNMWICASPILALPGREPWSDAPVRSQSARTLARSVTGFYHSAASSYDYQSAAGAVKEVL
jgi:hypothetical protein